MYFLREQIDTMPLGPKIQLSIALAAEVLQSSMNNGRDPNGNGQAGDPTVLACVVFETQESVIRCAPSRHTRPVFASDALPRISGSSMRKPPNIWASRKALSTNTPAN